MNILLISQCDKRALTETRRILDQFAERRGDRTWQTPITQNGVDTLRRLLRASARKNTAVACHWIRAQNHTELLWIVGDKNRFNSEGAVPTNTTQRNILRQEDENQHHSAEDIHLLAALAALLHDLGKASTAFQQRLQGERTERNQYRHEWVSLRLFQAFVGKDSDTDWLDRLANPKDTDAHEWLERIQRDGCIPIEQCEAPFQALAHAPLAQAIGWLIVTHHRLPLLANENNGTGWWAPRTDFSQAHLVKGLSEMQASWNEVVVPAQADTLAYWDFPMGLPVQLPHWQVQAKRLAQRLQRLLTRPDRTGYHWLQQPYIMHLSRLTLMLADHHYSSLSTDQHGQRATERLHVPPGCTLWANTYTNRRGQRLGNQTLDEHLLGVTKQSQRISHALPDLIRSLPGLLQHKPLKQRTTSPRFAWQNQASDCATQWRVAAAEHGAFIINMASTGYGKTLANARIMNALADPKCGLRCTFAMGLRTLTLQTGQAFQQLLGLGPEHLAIRVGGQSQQALMRHFEERSESSGSLSRQALLLEEDEEGSVEFADDAGFDARHPIVARTLHDPKMKKLLLAPLLVCTIDHLTPATEGLRGGRQIAPMLRLFSSDLVLDEPDDFDLNDLPALTRLVHWAGLLGSRVLLSSATLAPALVQGLFLAYQAGRQAFQRHRSSHPSTAEQTPPIVTMWVDEFSQHATTCPIQAQFEEQHLLFVQRRYARLAQIAKDQPQRRGKFIPTQSLAAAASPAERYTAMADLLQESAWQLHRAHASTDPHCPTKKISFGLIRMANIGPLIEVALAWFRRGNTIPNAHVHLCVYHSQFPLLLRSEIERRLDQTLKRHNPMQVFSLPEIRHCLSAYPEAEHHLFIVLGSPVTEVGRDHDYDWAIVEPSSMRSLIQLAGRVRRHRPGACLEPNVSILNQNLRALTHPAEAAFCHPGFESAEYQLAKHKLSEVLRQEECDLMRKEQIDARPRLLAATPLMPNVRWIDLEHHRLQSAMLPIAAANDPGSRSRRGRGQHQKPNAASCWQIPNTHLTGLLVQHSPFRHDTMPHEDVCLRLNDEGEIELTEVVSEKASVGFAAVRHLPITHRLKPWPDDVVQGVGISAWMGFDYAQALDQLATAMELSPQQCAERFGTVSLPASTQGWWWHSALGFLKCK